MSLPLLARSLSRPFRSLANTRRAYGRLRPSFEYTGACTLRKRPRSRIGCHSSLRLDYPATAARRRAAHLGHAGLPAIGEEAQVAERDRWSRVALEELRRRGARSGALHDASAAAAPASRARPAPPLPRLGRGLHPQLLSNSPRIVYILIKRSLARASRRFHAHLVRVVPTFPQ